jgi:general secretion pathway protein G
MKLNQKGFATLEIILMVMVVGILATMAVPQFEKVTAQANTAKVQSDLAAINSAIAIYQMEKGTVPTYSQLTNDNATYFENGVPQAPTGKIYIDGTLTDIGTSTYGVTNGKATFSGQTAEHFTAKSSN